MKLVIIDFLLISYRYLIQLDLMAGLTPLLPPMSLDHQMENKYLHEFSSIKLQELLNCP